MKLRYKFLAILTLTSLLILATSTIILSKKFIDDKKESIYENHTVAALHLSDKLTQYFKLLKSELHLSLPDFDKRFPEILKMTGKHNKAILTRKDDSLPTYTPNLVEEIKLLNGHLVWHISDTTIIFKQDFFERFTQMTPATSLGLIPMNQNEILSLAKGIEFPSSNLLTQALTQQNKQAVVASFSKMNNHDTLTVLAPIPELPNTLLLLQTKHKLISEILSSALKEMLPPLLLVGIVLILIAIFFSNKITTSLENLATATKKMAIGEYQLNLVARSNDEIGQLTKSFNQLGADLELREQKIKEVNQKLVQAEKLASLGMFSAGIAHEVKNPLGAILGNAQLIKRKINPDQSDALRYSEVIIKESYRATHIIEDLLVFAKERPLNITNFTFENLANEIKNTCEPKCNEAVITLTIEPQQIELHADKEQLIQVLQNIIFNACDALENVARDQKVINVNCENKESNFFINIKDNAEGIAKENLDKIFEPFFSTKKIKKGTGLGMAISYGIIQKHNGQILVDSEIGKGTKFTIVLPHRI